MVSGVEPAESAQVSDGKFGALFGVPLIHNPLATVRSELLVVSTTIYM
jgi:hypothetical protein